MFLLLTLFAALGVTSYYAVPKPTGKLIAASFTGVRSKIMGFFDLNPVVPILENKLSFEEQDSLEPGLKFVRETGTQVLDRVVDEWVGGVVNQPSSTWWIALIPTPISVGELGFQQRPGRDNDLGNISSWLQFDQVRDIYLEIGVLEFATLAQLPISNIFKSVIGIDSFNLSEDAQFNAYTEYLARCKLASNGVILKALSEKVLPFLKDDLSVEKRQVTTIFYDGDFGKMMVASCLLAFDLLAIGGVMIITVQSEDDLKGVDDWNAGKYPYLTNGINFLRIIEGEFEFLPRANNSCLRIAIRKVEFTGNKTVAGLPVRSSPFLGSHPFSLVHTTIDSLNHDFENVHMVNFFGLGTRKDRCCKCGFIFEQAHNSGWYEKLLKHAPAMCSPAV